MSDATPTHWTTAEAIDLCRKVEAVCPPCGCHVALTGGLLYRDGPRKDCDLLFYRIRQVPKIDWSALENELANLGIDSISGFGWYYKAKFNGKPIDIFVPEENAVDSDGNEMTYDEFVQRQALIESREPQP